MPQILDAALEEFAERGYAGARMAAVAARAGIAKGLIYHYFPSKAALFLATIRACTQPVFEAAERRLQAGGGSARAMLTELIGLAYRRLDEGGRERALFRLIVAEADRFPELARFYQEEVLSRATALVGGVLRRGAATGEFRADAAAIPGLAEVVLAPAVAASVWRMILGPHAAPDPQAARAAHLELLLAGLAPRR